MRKLRQNFIIDKTASKAQKIYKKKVQTRPQSNIKLQKLPHKSTKLPEVLAKKREIAILLTFSAKQRKILQVDVMEGFKCMELTHLSRKILQRFYPV